MTPSTSTAADPNTAPLSVNVAYARRLFDVVERFGLPRAVLLKHARVGRTDWEAAQARLPLADLVTLFESALTLSGRRDLVLEFGRQVRPDTFDVLGYALMTCRNLGEAIGLVPLYGRVVFDSGYSETRFSREGANVKMTWVVLPEATQAGLPYSELLTESLIASWFRLGRWIAGTDMPLVEARFRHAAPEDTVPFETFFDCPVRFAAGENALLFSSDLLALPLVRADAELNLAMRDEARKVIDRQDLGEDIGGQVRQMLVPLMPKCEASLKCVASGLGLTPRTLQRRLASAEFSFQTLLDATRRELAQVYLRDPALSALDVALLLGYAEQSSFTRAFKSWFGQTPTAYRQSQ
ncbi:MAG: AraC family transcriptional regulator [Sulfuritalea sp.]|nr:AraC family transcriptional regulator [Sulfuritalea sp.]